MALTVKQRLFVDAYIGEANCNATEAARLAGYADPKNEGYRLTHRDDIRAAIDQRMRDLTIGPEEILFRLTAQARGNLKDLEDENGSLPESTATLTRQQAAIIKKHSVRPGQHGTAVSVEIYDAQSALLALAKRYDLFPDRLNVNVSELDAAISAGLAKLATREEAGPAGED